MQSLLNIRTKLAVSASQVTELHLSVWEQFNTFISIGHVLQYCTGARLSRARWSLCIFYVNKIIIAETFPPTAQYWEIDSWTVKVLKKQTFVIPT